MAKNSWTKTVEVDPETGDYYIDLKEACKELGWRAGDVIEWIDNKDGTWMIKKKDTNVES